MNKNNSKNVINNKEINSNQKKNNKKDQTKAPSTYQKGVIPKYLLKRKREMEDFLNMKSNGDRVLLPEEDRKQTLRILKEGVIVNFLKILLHKISYIYI